jgi:uncharacterized protein (TIGR00251 family)
VKKDDLELMPFPGGTRLRLRVKAGAKKTAIVGVHGGALKVSVAAAPERGKANRAVVALLADVLGLAPSGVAIVSGKTSQDKVAEVALDVATVCAILADLELPKKR